MFITAGISINVIPKITPPIPPAIYQNLIPNKSVTGPAIKSPNGAAAPNIVFDMVQTRPYISGAVPDCIIADIEPSSKGAINPPMNRQIIAMIKNAGGSALNII